MLFIKMKIILIFFKVFINILFIFKNPLKKNNENWDGKANLIKYIDYNYNIFLI